MVRASLAALIMVTACVGFAPAHAAQPTPSGTYDVRGSVQSRCSTGTSGGITSLETTVERSGRLPSNLDNRSFVLLGLMCSSASQIRVSATPLRRSPAFITISPGQSQTVNYTATASGWSPTAASVTTAMVSAIGADTVYVGAPQTLTTARAGSITVTVNNFSIVKGNGNSSKLIDGHYSATITVSLTPNI